MMKRPNAIFLGLTLALMLAPLTTPVRAQKPVSETASVEVTATIQAIDHDNRLITLKGEDGDVETIYAGPEVKRFDELKVGDKVTFRYYESLVYRIGRPGDPAPAAGDAPKLVRGTGAKPSATASKQETATVTIKAIDQKVPAVTVQTEDGRTSSFKVEDKKNLKGVNVGDKVVITYTQALLISVK
jgi:Cu/Ag efflux protein CusF